MLPLQGSCKVMAKDLVRTRRYVSKFYTMKTQLQAISLRIQGMRSNQQMAEAMKGATRVSRLFSPSLVLSLDRRKPGNRFVCSRKAEKPGNELS